MTGHSSDDGDSIRVNPANDITAAPPPSIPRPSSSSASTVGSADMTTSTPSSSTKKSVLVYHHQPKGAPVVKNGLAVLTLAQLDAVLTAHPELKKTEKEIAKNTRHFELTQRDFWTPVERSQYAGLPNSYSKLVGLTVGFRILFLGWEDLVILS